MAMSPSPEAMTSGNQTKPWGRHMTAQNTKAQDIIDIRAIQSDALSDNDLDLVVGGGGSGKSTHPAPPNRFPYSGGAALGYAY